MIDAIVVVLDFVSNDAAYSALQFIESSSPILDAKCIP